MEKRRGFFGLFHDLDLNISILMLMGIIFITVMGVVMRYFVGKPITWLEEVQLWFIVWIVFYGASAVARKTGHIAIDAFVGLFPRKLRMWTTAISSAVSFAVLAFLGYYALRHVNQMYNSERVTNILSIPYWLIYSAVPISCLLMVANSAAVFHKVMFGTDRGPTHV